MRAEPTAYFAVSLDFYSDNTRLKAGLNFRLAKSETGKRPITELYDIKLPQSGMSSLGMFQGYVARKKWIAPHNSVSLAGWQLLPPTATGCKRLSACTTFCLVVVIFHI